MRATVLSLSVVLVCALAWADNSEQQPGAKALFYDTTSNVTVSGGPPQGSGSPRQPSKPAAPRITKPTTGLMYYVELVKPSGEMLRVNSTRVFRSGERIRLHFQTNVDGRLVIVQKQKDGSSQVLYPDKRINGGDNRIKASFDTIIPSEKAWFRFDNKPGEEKIMVFLTTESGYDTIRRDVAEENLDGKKTLTLASRIERQRGSKALVLEVDEKSEKPATYVVASVSASKEKAQAQEPAGLVTTEIVLNHQ